MLVNFILSYSCNVVKPLEEDCMFLVTSFLFAKNAGNHHYLHFPQCFLLFQKQFPRVELYFNLVGECCNPFPKRQILDSSKLKELADDNCKFGKIGRRVIPTGRKHCGKRRNCSLRAISPFPTVFSKDLYCRQVKTRACLGKG